MNGSDPDRIVAEGQWGTVEFAVRASGAMLARRFLLDLGMKAAPLIALFQEMADRGAIANPSRFSQERGKIYAFKGKVGGRMVRFPCFQLRSRWLLTHGFFKSGGKWRSEELDRADEIMKEHIQNHEG